jgi:hypothetical protein
LPKASKAKKGKRMSHNRNRSIRRQEEAEAKCKALGHDWDEKVYTYNEHSPYLPQGVVGWSQECKRCHALTGRGEY